MDSDTVWNKLTFLELLFHIEEMQAQLRAENGIREIFVGYVGEVDESELTQHGTDEMREFFTAFDAPAIEVAATDLPDGVREIYLAEMHRLRTGEVKPTTDFEVVKSSGTD